MALHKQIFDDRDEQYSTLKGQQRRPITQETIEIFRQLQQDSMQGRNGEPFSDSTEIIRQMREERTKELNQR